MAAAVTTPTKYDPPRQPRQVTVPRLVVIAAAAAVLFLAQKVFLPLAIAMLVAFALSPLVTRLRHLGVSLIMAVMAVATALGAVMAVFAFVVFGQLAQLARNLPEFRENIIGKVEGLKLAGGEDGLVSQLSDMATAIGATVKLALPVGPAAQPPMAVEVVARTSVYDIMTSFLLPLVGPVGQAGLVIILVVFMLLERDQLRERFIRLVGSSDLNRTTQVLVEAGSRVGTYLLTQLLVNIIYAVPITVGLWVIGVPNALLWGLLTLVLRFVPYLGSILSAAFPVALAFAVSPGWSTVLWTGALFVFVEFVTSNVIEPWLYGSRTGITPLAVIISAMFWAFLWGPAGLVLSTPLTVCLVVLGRHIPQFDLFDILFGDAPVLAPHTSLYQRLLSGDRTEVAFHTEDALDMSGPNATALGDFYQFTAIPALIMAQDDRHRGVLLPDQELTLAATASVMVEDIAAFLADNPASQGDWRVKVIGGRWDLDNSSAEILAHFLTTLGTAVEAHGFAELAPARLGALVADGADCVILCFLDPSPSRASLLHVRRIKRLMPQLRVGVVLWEVPADIRAASQGLRRVAAVEPAKLAEAIEIGADFAVTNLQDACRAGRPQS